MPHSSIVDFLIEREGKGLADEDWLQLVILRQQSLMEAVDARILGQTKLGDVSHKGSWHGWTNLAAGLTQVSSEMPNGLEARGVYTFYEGSYESTRLPQNLLIYGFDRKGQWIKAIVSFWVSGFELKDKVAVITYTNPAQLCEEYKSLTPEKMFKAFGEVGNAHVQRREQLLLSARTMQQGMIMEDHLLQRLLIRTRSRA
jgi:hypothetical protein